MIRQEIIEMQKAQLIPASSTITIPIPAARSVGKQSSYSLLNNTTHNDIDVIGVILRVSDFYGDKSRRDIQQRNADTMGAVSLGDAGRAGFKACPRALWIRSDWARRGAATGQAWIADAFVGFRPRRG